MNYCNKCGKPSWDDKLSTIVPDLCRCSTTIKRYSIVCPSCQGTGRIPEVGYTANTSRECPACKGIGVVEVKEER